MGAETERVDGSNPRKVVETISPPFGGWYQPGTYKPDASALGTPQWWPNHTKQAKTCIPVSAWWVRARDHSLCNDQNYEPACAAKPLFWGWPSGAVVWCIFLFTAKANGCRDREGRWFKSQGGGGNYFSSFRWLVPAWNLQAWCQCSRNAVMVS
jgi:hypothetical protein